MYAPCPSHSICGFGVDEPPYYAKDLRTLILSIIKTLFGINMPEEPETIPPIEFDELVGLPMLCCFNADQITPLIDICGTPKYPFDLYYSLIGKTEPKLSVVDIMDIDSLVISKSDSKYFVTLEEFGAKTLEVIQKHYPHELKWWTIEACKKHSDSDLFRQSTRLERIRWNGRTELKNSGGSHHFGVARYLMSQGELYPGGTQIELPVYERYIDHILVEQAFKNWHFFILHEKVLQSIREIYTKDDLMYVSMCRISLNNKDNEDRIIAVYLNGIETNPKRQNLRDELIAASLDDTSDVQYQKLIGKKCIDMNALILDALASQ